MSVTVRLHAALREAAGQDALRVDAATIADVRTAVGTACPPLTARLAHCRFALDDEFVDEATPVRDGATVDVIPPVSGG
ncbi:MAG: MoaD/ThiS family protein [Planctomycetota bacterium]|nr:MoaD/ThiS family protein [Planctomycetota bacterium]